MGLNVRKPAFGVWEQQRRKPAWADQPAHLCSLISAFVIHLLESISKLAKSEISLVLVSVAEQAGLGMTWLETFSPRCPYIMIG